jgi:leucyl-tRNA synthetase
MEVYNFKSIEKKWQSHFEEKKIFKELKLHSSKTN